MQSYPHMCRSDHVEIGHADSSSEICPLCRAHDRIAELEDRIESAKSFVRSCMARGEKTMPLSAVLMMLGGSRKITVEEMAAIKAALCKAE